MHASIATLQRRFINGTRIFKQAGYDATVDELKEYVVGRDVIRPVINLSKGVIQKSLRYLMYFKQKRTGRVKAQRCADGRPVCEYITKEESSAPTVSTNALILVCFVAAIQHTHVVVGDIACAFLRSDYLSDWEDYICLEGLMVDILVQIVPEYAQYVFYTKTATKLLIT